MNNVNGKVSSVDEHIGYVIGNMNDVSDNMTIIIERVDRVNEYISYVNDGVCVVINNKIGVINNLTFYKDKMQLESQTAFTLKFKTHFLNKKST